MQIPIDGLKKMKASMILFLLNAINQIRAQPFEIMMNN